MNKLIVIFVLSAASLALAVENTVPVQVKGTGATRDLAIQNALYQAVAQVQGVAVRSDMRDVGVDTGHRDIERDPGTSQITTITGPAGAVTTETHGLPETVDTVGISTDSSAPVTLTDAKGLVKSYEVIEEKEVSAKVYEVTLRVLVYDYQSPEDTKKNRVAVFPFDAAVPARLIINHENGSAEIRELASQQRLGEQFSQYLTTMLARNEKFTVLDRDAQSAILKEKQILLSPDAPIEEKVRLGEALGADYMLVGDVLQLEIIVDEKYSQVIGAMSRQFTAILDTEYRLLVGPTRQVTASDQLRIRLEDAQVKALMEKWESDNIDYKEMEQNLVLRAAAQIADMAGDYLYPIRIAAVKEGGMLILNQGGKRLAEGDILEVHQPGANIIDPDTGKSLGAEVAMIVTAKVTKVMPKFSYASLAQGVTSDSLTGAVCKRLKAEPGPQAPQGRQSTIQETSSGGVRLPMDQRSNSQLMKDK